MGINSYLFQRCTNTSHYPNGAAGLSPTSAMSSTHELWIYIVGYDVQAVRKAPKLPLDKPIYFTGVPINFSFNLPDIVTVAVTRKGESRRLLGIRREHCNRRCCPGLFPHSNRREIPELHRPFPHPLPTRTSVQQASRLKCMLDFGWYQNGMRAASRILSCSVSTFCARALSMMASIIWDVVGLVVPFLKAA